MNNSIITPDLIKKILKIWRETDYHPYIFYSTTTLIEPSEEDFINVINNAQKSDNYIGYFFGKNLDISLNSPTINIK